MAIADTYIYDEINIGVNPLDVPITVFGKLSSYDDSNTGINPDDTTISSKGRVSAFDESNTGINVSTVEATSKLSSYDEENVISRGAGGAILPANN